MPNARGHVIGGVAFYAVASVFPWTAKYLPTAGAEKFVAGLPFVIFGALFPDIDTHSEGRKLLNFIVLVGISIACYTKRYAAILFFAPIPIFMRLASHRGVTHNPLFVSFVPAMFFYAVKPHFKWLPKFGIKYYAAFVVGAISHIVLDLVQTTLKRKGFIKSNKFRSTKKALKRFRWW